MPSFTEKELNESSNIYTKYVTSSFMRIDVGSDIDITDVKLHLCRGVRRFLSTEACEGAMIYILEKEFCGGVSPHSSSPNTREHNDFGIGFVLSDGTPYTKLQRNI